MGGGKFKMDYILTPDGELCLYHHGIKGMKWGVRRYQNKDGSLTPAGKKRLADYKSNESSKIDKKYNTRREDRRFDRASGQMIRAVESGNADAKRRASNRQKIAYRDKLYKQGLAAAEKTKVANMSYDDMRREKQTIGMRYAKAALVTVGSHAAMFAGVSPVALVSVPIHNNRYKSRLRLDKAEVNSIHKKAVEDAERVYSPVKKDNKSTVVFDESTRVTGQREADFWRALAEEELKRRGLS